MGVVGGFHNNTPFALSSSNDIIRQPGGLGLPQAAADEKRGMAVLFRIDGTLRQVQQNKPRLSCVSILFVLCHRFHQILTGFLALSATSCKTNAEPTPLLISLALQPPVTIAFSMIRMDKSSAISVLFYPPSGSMIMFRTVIAWTSSCGHTAQTLL
jgi:hypothetical protein